MARVMTRRPGPAPASAAGSPTPANAAAAASSAAIAAREISMVSWRRQLGGGKGGDVLSMDSLIIYDINYYIV